MHEYELMMIVAQREVKEGVQEKVIEEIRGMIEGLGGRVLRVRPWGLRQLSYEIKGYDYGYYVILQLLIEPAKTREFEAKLKLNEQVIRHMMLLLEKREEGDVSVLQEMVGEEEIDSIANKVRSETAAPEEDQAPAASDKTSAKDA
ncbi:30S ribosomal protein S6 [Candidatus Wirthbacteria bacterium CG2_30_54_11]|uniref:Small ribosomal subunit protein bS6 n=1 Tax=Candidatus Wirthbacteria bacterium CG2_30_54_11 TaxID=1817892 RepID=A0A1J5IUC0_9BACT|nr:MAG: 30S ribosomal protein S6 [Candidatus Wirthbacteria bacterium CG2_30_54_11]